MAEHSDGASVGGELVGNSLIVIELAHLQQPDGTQNTGLKILSTAGPFVPTPANLVTVLAPLVEELRQRAGIPRIALARNGSGGLN